MRQKVVAYATVINALMLAQESLHLAISTILHLKVMSSANTISSL
ncbi:hypothetical protein BTN50_1551 [Candidatus Enterovibrio altilux]|uniref:Uncharacterized protein n=1 Tax=Candidatus Enterovibrio altilux TaxID=1927128 RepID=A0A291BAL4_9GAMM|nr:hypothetical protein BTN50_1551 [Candidatus Enterovibrio luxaltus]